MPAGAPPVIVDIGSLTIRNDEFRAVLEAFPNGEGVHRGKRREYTLRHAETADGERYTLAILKQIEQGNGEVQDAARDLLDDLESTMLLVVGIAAGRPSDDITLGDVVIATRVNDYTVEARKAREKTTYNVSGGPIAKELQARVANLVVREKDLGRWTSKPPDRPKVSWSRKGQLLSASHSPIPVHQRSQ
jgi:nucleoside phosphorylase